MGYSSGIGYSVGDNQVNIRGGGGYSKNYDRGVWDKYAIQKGGADYLRDHYKDVRSNVDSVGNRIQDARQIEANDLAKRLSAFNAGDQGALTQDEITKFGGNLSTGSGRAVASQVLNQGFNQGESDYRQGQINQSSDTKGFYAKEDKYIKSQKSQAFGKFARAAGLSLAAVGGLGALGAFSGGAGAGLTGVSAGGATAGVGSSGLSAGALNLAGGGALLPSLSAPTFGSFAANTALKGALKGGLQGYAKDGDFSSALKGAALGGATSGYGGGIGSGLGLSGNNLSAFQSALTGAGSGALQDGAAGALRGGLTGAASSYAGDYLGGGEGGDLAGGQGSDALATPTSEALLGAPESSLGNVASSSLGGSTVSKGLGMLKNYASPLATALSGFQNYRASQDAEDEYKKYREQGLAGIDPYSQAGLAASQSLSDKLASGELGGTFNPEDFAGDAGYDFRKAEGEQALDRMQSARGSRFSGSALKAASEYGQAMASDEYQNAYNRWAQQQGLTYDMLSGQQSTGYNAALNRSNILGDIGLTSGQGTIDRSNIATKTLSDLLNGYQNNKWGF